MKKFGRKTVAGVLCFAMLTSTLTAPAQSAFAAGGVVINEVCTKNTTYQASDGGFYDWVELYNGTGSTVDLSGWGLTDKADTPYRFTFPQGSSIAAGGRLIVFCDGDAAAVNNAVAPFGLSATGEELTLTDRNGSTADTAVIDALATDMSYSRYPDGSGDFFTTRCTPNSTNAAPEGENAVKQPEFSAESGFYNNSFMLTISAAQGTRVYYTTDGSNPTAASTEYTGAISIEDMTNTPNRLSMRTDISTDKVEAPNEGVDKAAIIRAVAIDSQGRVSPIVTKTYFVGTTASSYYQNMKVVSLVTDPDNLFDNEKGIYVLGNKYQGGGGIGGWNMGGDPGQQGGWNMGGDPAQQGGWNMGGDPAQQGGWNMGGDPAQQGGWNMGGAGQGGWNIGGMGNVQINADEPGQQGGWNMGGAGGFDFGGMGGFDFGAMGFGVAAANYTQKGREWEREASFEMFENGESVIAQNVGIRIKGAYSRSYVQKSFNIYSRADYGPTKLEYDFFDGTATKAKNGKAIKKFDGITIRNGGNDCGYTYFRDTITQRLIDDRSICHQAMSECVLFIDGEFWGVYQICERESDDYIDSHYGIDKDDVAIVKNGQLEEGLDSNLQEFNQALQQITNADMSNASNYSLFTNNFDEQSFIDYFAAQIYWANSDWPQNNYAAWKANTVDAENPYADGKWRMFLFDTESGQGLYTSGANDATVNTFSRIQRNYDNLSRMFTNLLKNPTFRQKFELTMMDLANYNFDPSKTTDLINYYWNTYKEQMLDTYERFYSQSKSGAKGQETLNNEYNKLINFYKVRCNTVTSTMKSALGLTGNLATITVNNDRNSGTIGVNTLTIDDTSSWSGQYFTDFPVTLKANANEGRTFDHWEVSGGTVNGSLTSPEISVTLSGNTTVKAVYSNGGTPSYTQKKGDYNGDGQVNQSDLSLLNDYLLGKKVNLKTADVIEDGVTDIYDLIALRNQLSK